MRTSCATRTSYAEHGDRGVWGWHPHPGFGGGTPKYKPLASKNLHSQPWNFPFCSVLYLYFISVHCTNLLGLGLKILVCISAVIKILIIIYAVKFEPPCGNILHRYIDNLPLLEFGDVFYYAIR